MLWCLAHWDGAGGSEVRGYDGAGGGASPGSRRFALSTLMLAYHTASIIDEQEENEEESLMTIL